LAPERLIESAANIIEDPENDVYVSPVSAWEIAIKQSLNKLTLPHDAENWLPSACETTGFS
jgi:PIN domain nuclease of toxin-antitoxin system